jgi:hypothetical protein
LAEVFQMAAFQMAAFQMAASQPEQSRTNIQTACNRLGNSYTDPIHPT